jgi:hypothetical protein
MAAARLTGPARPAPPASCGEPPAKRDVLVQPVIKREQEPCDEDASEDVIHADERIQHVQEDETQAEYDNGPAMTGPL